MNSLTPIASLSSTAHGAGRRARRAAPSAGPGRGAGDDRAPHRVAGHFVGRIPPRQRLAGAHAGGVDLAALFARVERLVAPALAGARRHGALRGRPAALTLMADGGQLEQALLTCSATRPTRRRAWPCPRAGERAPDARRAPGHRGARQRPRRAARPGAARSSCRSSARASTAAASAWPWSATSCRAWGQRPARPAGQRRRGVRAVVLRRSGRAGALAGDRGQACPRRDRGMCLQ